MPPLLFVFGHEAGGILRHPKNSVASVESCAFILGSLCFCGGEEGSGFAVDAVAAACRLARRGRGFSAGSSRHPNISVASVASRLPCLFLGSLSVCGGGGSWGFAVNAVAVACFQGRGGRLLFAVGSRHPNLNVASLASCTFFQGSLCLCGGEEEEVSLLKQFCRSNFPNQQHHCAVMRIVHFSPSIRCGIKVCDGICLPIVGPVHLVRR